LACAFTFASPLDLQPRRQMDQVYEDIHSRILDAVPMAQDMPTPRSKERRKEALKGMRDFLRGELDLLADSDSHEVSPVFMRFSISCQVQNGTQNPDEGENPAGDPPVPEKPSPLERRLNKIFDSVPVIKINAGGVVKVFQTDLMKMKHEDRENAAFRRLLQGYEPFDVEVIVSLPVPVLSWSI
jgi:hypothetical protein